MSSIPLPQGTPHFHRTISVDAGSSPARTPPPRKDALLPFSGIRQRAASSSSRTVSPQSPPKSTQGADHSVKNDEEEVPAARKRRLLRQLSDTKREKEDYRRQYQEIVRSVEANKSRYEELRQELLEIDASVTAPPEKKTLRLEPSANMKISSASSKSWQPAKKAGSSLSAAGSYLPPIMLEQLLGTEVCAICLDNLHGQAQTIALCGHIFHRSCLSAMGSFSCPQCRQPIDQLRNFPARFKMLKRLILGAASDLAVVVPPNIRETTISELLVKVNFARAEEEAAFTQSELREGVGALSNEHGGSVLLDGDSVSFVCLMGS